MSLTVRLFTVEFWVTDYQSCINELPAFSRIDQVRLHAARTRQFRLRPSTTKRLLQPPGEKTLRRRRGEGRGGADGRRRRGEGRGGGRRREGRRKRRGVGGGERGGGGGPGEEDEEEKKEEERVEEEKEGRR